MASSGEEISPSSGESDSIEIEVPGFFRIYKSGRFTRLIGTDKLPPSLDPSSTGVSSKDITIGSFSVRLYLPSTIPSSGRKRKLPVLIYFHGGAFCLESSASPTYHHHLNTLSSLTPLIAVSVDYRLAPEHPLPAAYDDSLAAVRWVFSLPDPWLAEHADLNRVFLAGDSAGANIAHYVALRSEVRFKGVALIHPYFWGSDPVGSESDDPGLRAHVERIWKFVCPDSVGADDPWINFMAGDAPGLEGLRCERVLVAVAEKDLVRFRGKAYYEKLKESGWGGEAELVEEPDAEHVFHLFHPETEKAKEMVRVLVDFFNRE